MAEIFVINVFELFEFQVRVVLSLANNSCDGPVDSD
jgi:hypothetical protein